MPCIFTLLSTFHKNISGVFPAEPVFLPRMESQLCKTTQAANTERFVTGTGEKGHLIFGLANRLQIKELKTLEGFPYTLHPRRH